MNEIWKPVIGYEGLYEISDLGRVRWPLNRPANTKMTPGTILGTWIDDQGYRRATLRGKNNRQRIQLVHVLVARAFIGPCPAGLECNHKNGLRKDDASVGNLEYVTHLQNVAHSHATGLAVILRGESHGSAKINDLIVRIIRRCIEIGMKQRHVAAVFKIDRSTVGYINSRKLWRHVRSAA